MKKNKSEEVITGKPIFVPIVKWYEVLQDLEMRYIDYMVEDNINGVMAIYQFLYAKIHAYIEKYIKQDTKIEEALKLDDVYAKRMELKNGGTDFDIRHNMSIMPQIKELMMNKMAILYTLMAKAELTMPLEKAIKDRPAALAGDDFIIDD